MPSEVFLITEVLEMILLATDTCTLLLSRRVCRRWRNLIQGSHFLRAALFLEPVRYLLPGVVEMDSKMSGTPAYTESKAKKTIRMGDVLFHYYRNRHKLYQPLPDDGIFWYGLLPKTGKLEYV